jgi:hypothetical protein
MKTVFVTLHGALVEDGTERWALHCNASAGLRLLAELDFRVIVLDNGMSTLPPLTPSRTSLPADQYDAQAQARARPLRHEQRQSRAPVPVPMQTPAPAQTGQGRRSDHAADSRQDSPRGLRQREHVTELLRREQLPLQDFYGCAHHYDRAEAASRFACALRAAVADLDLSPRSSTVHAEHASELSASKAAVHDAGSILGAGSRFARAAHAATAPSACACLPPQPLLLLRAAAEHSIDLPASWMLGADLDAVEAGNRAGCRTVLIDNGTEHVWRLGRGRIPTRIAPDLHAAALLIVEEGQRMRLF